MPSLDINEVRYYLPHRYPFLLVDKVVDYELGKSMTGIKNVSHNEPFFNGHFPERPIMPGVLMIEALAQLCGLLVFKTFNAEPSEENWFFLAGVDNARFKHRVEPGDQLILTIDVIKARQNLWKVHGEAKVEQHLACSVDIMIARGALSD